MPGLSCTQRPAAGIWVRAGITTRHCHIGHDNTHANDNTEQPHGRGQSTLGTNPVLEVDKRCDTPRVSPSCTLPTRWACSTHRAQLWLVSRCCDARDEGWIGGDASAVTAHPCREEARHMRPPCQHPPEKRQGGVRNASPHSPTLHRIPHCTTQTAAPRTSGRFRMSALTTWCSDWQGSFMWGNTRH